MDIEKILFIPSKSRYELSIEEKGSEEEAKASFSSEKVWERIRTSHFLQKENIGKFRDNFSPEQIVDRSRLTPEMIQQYETFAFLGGDNHFGYCAQEVMKYLQANPQDTKRVMGVVLDPTKSLGALLYFNTDTFLDNVEKLRDDNYEIENWTTLEAKVFGDKQPHPAIGDYFVGELNRLDMSRTIVSIDGQEVDCPEKSSGLLIAVGAASSRGSWYNNLHFSTFKEGDEFPKDADYARIFVTENWQRKKFTLNRGQVLTLDSYNDGSGVISPDSQLDHTAEFEMGKKAEIRLSDQYLTVIRI